MRLFLLKLGGNIHIRKVFNVVQLAIILGAWVIDVLLVTWME